jgi:DedD protein
MDEGAKRRLVGAAVLVALAVIFVPMLLDDKDADDGLGEPIVIPDAPAFDSAEDDAGDGLTPLLPSPESPTAGIDQGAEPVDRGASLPTPLPPSQSGASSQSEAQSAAQARPRQAPPSDSQAAGQAAAGQAAGQAARPAAAGPKPVPAGSAAWVVQVASLGSSAAATKLQNELRGQGYPAFVEQATVNGRLYFRVRIGPETNRDKANGVAAKLQRETVHKPLVQTYR